MEPIIWIRLILAILADRLDSDGETERAELIRDLLAAELAGRDIDDLLAQAATNWVENGPPTYDEIRQTRLEIQSRM